MNWKQPIPTEIPECGGDEFAQTLFQLLVLRASNEDRNVYLEDGSMIFLKRGQTIFGRNRWAKILGMNTRSSLKVFRKLVKLEKVYKLVNNQKSRNCTIVTILNYDKVTSFEQSNEQTVNNQRTINEQTVNTYKSNNTSKNVKNVNNIYTPPSPKEVLQFSEKEILSYRNFIKFFNELTGKKFWDTNPELRRKYLARVREGYKREHFEKAIKAILEDKYHKEQNYKYLTPEFVLRSTKLELYLNSETKPKKTSAFAEIIKQKQEIKTQ